MTDYAARIQYLIDIMKVVKERNLELVMNQWYSKKAQGYFGEVYNEHVDVFNAMESGGVDQYLNSCGTAACFAGWCSLDPAIRDTGDIPMNNVINFVTKIYADDAELMTTLESGLRSYIIDRLAGLACYGDKSVMETAFDNYGVDDQNITVDMVIEKLYTLKANCTQVQNMINEMKGTK